MSSIFSRFAPGLSLIGIMAAVLIPTPIESFKSYSTYEYGKKRGDAQGYDRAKQEFYDKIAFSDETNHVVVESDRVFALLTSDPLCFGRNIYVRNAALILLQPKWNLEVFGEDYVVRLPEKSFHREAWIVPKNTSNELDATLRRIILTTPGSFLKDKISEADLEKLEEASHFKTYAAIRGFIP